MGYIENNLNRDEKIIATAKFSWVALLGAIIKAAIWIAIGVGLGIVKGKLPQEAAIASMLGKMIDYISYLFYAIAALIILVRILVLSTSKLAITDMRVIGKQGVLKKVALDIPLANVDNMLVKSSVLGSIFGFGSVIVKSTRDQWGYKFIAKPDVFKRSLTDAIDQAKEKERIEQAKAIAEAMNAAKAQ